jgi:hypothetical protein
MKTISDYEPEFTPVALDRVRHDGWTPERQVMYSFCILWFFMSQQPTRPPNLGFCLVVA